MISENKSKTIQVRITETDYKYLLYVSSLVGLTTSQYVRSIITATVNAAKAQEKKGAIKVEDIEAVLNDKLQHD